MLARPYIKFPGRNSVLFQKRQPCNLNFCTQTTYPTDEWSGVLTPGLLVAGTNESLHETFKFIQTVFRFEENALASACLFLTVMAAIDSNRGSIYRFVVYSYVNLQYIHAFSERGYTRMPLSLYTYIDPTFTRTHVPTQIHTSQTHTTYIFHKKNINGVRVLAPFAKLCVPVHMCVCVYIYTRIYA